MQGSWEKHVIHYVNEDEIDSAISKMGMVDEVTQNELIYNFSHVFMKKRPERTVQMLLDLGIPFNPLKLVTSIMNIPKEFNQVAIEFLVP